jgi:hypothetical protein
MLDALGGYILGVAIGLDVLANAILAGKRYQTISCRIGESIESGGWASRVPWPAAFIKHFKSAIYVTTV